LDDMFNIDGMTLEHVLLLLRRFTDSMVISKLSNVSGESHLQQPMTFTTL